MASVRTAIRAVETDKVDGDGVPDRQEIIDGTEPNAPGTATDIQDPQLGCRLGGGAGGRGATAGSTILLVRLIRRRRRR